VEDIAGNGVIENRIEAFRKRLKTKNIDGFLVLNQSNRRFLSGYTGHDTGIDESAGALIITRNDLILLTDSRFDVQAANEAPLYQVRCYKTGLQEHIPDILNSLGCNKLGFEGSRMSYAMYCKIKETINSNNVKTEFIPADEVVDDLRVIKSDDEVDIMRKALSIAESAYTKTLAMVKPGLTETALAWELEKNMREGGAEGLSFPSIVAAGPNSALPHAIPGKRTVRENEPLLFDWGAVYEGYCSDTSRTLSVGKPDETFLKLYDILFDAQRMAIEAIRPGVSTKTVDGIARGHIGKFGYEKNFGHGLGHGVGLEIHEAPRLSPLKESILEKGMIVTVEPGIYLPEWGGIRLENMVLVTEDGAEVLNTLSYEDRIIEL
jgi:Xaa-Pro aminopeptidase